MIRNIEATEDTSWGSEGRCKRPSGVRGGARSKKYMSKWTLGFFIIINSMILYFKHIIHIDDFPLNGHPPSGPTPNKALFKELVAPPWEI